MYTSPSPLPRRDPLRLPFSVHIRKLFFLFSQLRSLHHPPLIPHLSHRRSGHASRRGWGLSLCLPCRGPVLAPRRGRRPRRPVLYSLTKGVFRAPSRQPFAHGGKRLQKRRQRPMVFGIPFVRLQSRRKKVPQRIACTSIPAAAPTPRAAALCSPNIKNRRPKGPHLHLPPLAASARFDNRSNR